MRTFYIFSLSCLLSNVVIGQPYDVNYHSCNLCTGGNINYILTPTPFDLTGSGILDVVSDFGRRNNSSSKWHKGVDITIKDPSTEDRDYHLLSITNGRILRILGNAGSYKLISIEGTGADAGQNFGYGHIFENSGMYPIRRGDMTIDMYVINGMNEHVIIYEHPVNGPIALARTDGETISYVELQGNPYSLVTNNLVNQNDPIAPLGTSGNVPSHLHLYRFEDPNISTISGITDPYNCKDPLQAINHYNTQYTTSITPQIDFDGTNNSKIRTRVQMQTTASYGSAADQWYSGGIMNVEQVEILIKKDYESNLDYTLIQGTDYEFRITEFSLDQCVPGCVPNNYGFYPSFNDVAGPNTSDDGSWTNTGIDPFAYGSTTTNTPYDDFYFLNFPTRIHKDDPMDGNTTPTLMYPMCRTV